ncbi:MAG TPA: TetR family transcriptional regulator [Gaiellaceae bacterium]|nr:TetR family transcriptional regulator [Gaiellaceae bacterium]
MEPVGLRERKKLQTREALRRAAWALFAERGYDATTLADIADAAGVSTRTIFAYFPSKEDIVFCEFESMRGALAVALAERPAGQDALGALRDFIVSSAHEKADGEGIEQVIAADETLRSHKRARIAEFQDIVAAAIAEDLGAGPDDLRPQVAAASLTAAFEVLEREGGGKPHDAADVAAAIDPIIAFVRAGLNALPAG